MFYGYSSLIIQGTLMTLALTLLSIICSTLIGIIGGLCTTSEFRMLRFFSVVYTTAIRSVPDLVLMLLTFYSVQILINWLFTIVGIGKVDINAFGAGVITLAFIYGAYMAETFRGAFESVPVGQLEAGKSTGMSNWLVFRVIKLPQMIRFALPGYTNNLLVLIKATALVSIMGLDDIISLTQQAGRSTQHLLFFNLVAAAVYLSFTCIALLLLSQVRKRFNVGIKEALL